MVEMVEQLSHRVKMIAADDRPNMKSRIVKYTLNQVMGFF